METRSMISEQAISNNSSRNLHSGYSTKPKSTSIKESKDNSITRLNFYQFYNWISVHKTLYENYYDGFHNTIWEIDPQSKKPKYLLSGC